MKVVRARSEEPPSSMVVSLPWTAGNGNSSPLVEFELEDTAVTASQLMVIVSLMGRAGTKNRWAEAVGLAKV